MRLRLSRRQLIPIFPGSLETLDPSHLRDVQVSNSTVFATIAVGLHQLHRPSRRCSFGDRMPDISRHPRHLGSNFKQVGA